MHFYSPLQVHACPDLASLTPTREPLLLTGTTTTDTAGRHLNALLVQDMHIHLRHALGPGKSARLDHASRNLPVIDRALHVTLHCTASTLQAMHGYAYGGMPVANLAHRR